jgi:hypothetical protein
MHLYQTLVYVPAMETVFYVPCIYNDHFTLIFTTEGITVFYHNIYSFLNFTRNTYEKATLYFTLHALLFCVTFKKILIKLIAEYID